MGDILARKRKTAPEGAVEENPSRVWKSTYVKLKARPVPRVKQHVRQWVTKSSLETL
jgi:hypothetical protein